MSGFLRRLLLRLSPERAFTHALLGDLDEERERDRRRLGGTRASGRYLARLLSVCLHFARARWSGGFGDDAGQRPGYEVPPSRREMLEEMTFGLGRALRVLRLRPGTSALAVGTIALASAVGLVVFAVADRVLLRPLPYAETERLVDVWSETAGTGRGYPGTTPDGVLRLRERGELFEAVEAWEMGSALLTGVGEPADISVGEFTPGLVDLLGVAPLLGRSFEAADAGRSVALVSEGFWRTRLGANREALGREIHLDDVAHRVIGVMPDHFRHPDPAVQVWVPLDLEATDRSRVVTMARTTGLPDDPAVQSRLSAAAADLRQADVLPQGFVLRLWKQQEWLRFLLPDGAREGLWALLGAVVLVLIIAVANLANLRLVDILGREREFVIAAALGATRGRLVRQILLETVLLASAGAAVGALLAMGLLEAVVASAPDNVEFLHQQKITIDARVLAVLAAVTVLAGGAAGVVPAWRAARGSLSRALAAGGRGASISRGQKRLRAGLVVVETALSTFLLLGAGLLIKSLLTLHAVAPGFAIDDLVVAEIALGPSRYPGAPAKLDALRRLQTGLRSIPGVGDASVAHGSPPRLVRMSFLRPSYVEGSDPGETDAGFGPAAGDFVSAAWVPSEWFRVMGITPLRGRLIEPGDGDDVIVIGETLARRYWDGREAVGSRLRLSPGGPWITVVGVVADLRFSGYDEAADRMEIYRPLAAIDEDSKAFQLLLRTERTDARLTAAIREAVQRIDADIPIESVSTMRQAFSADLARQRFNLLVLGVLATVGALLAALGLYGVVAHGVRTGMRELGIRLALGASPAGLFRQVFAGGVALAAGGVTIGAASGIALGRWLQSTLHGVSSSDPTVLALIVVGALGLAGVAAGLPASRATRLDPVRPLRSE